MSKRWNIKSADETAVQCLQDATGLPDSMARLLVQRGYDEPDHANVFLNPRLADLSDPFLLPDMAQAVQRIWTAIDAGEAITVFGDYDVDGVTSASLLTRILRQLGGVVHPFIPDRIDEGYGLSLEALKRCVEKDHATVLITVDCGTNSVESAELAQGLGVDLIITDHHEPDEKTAAVYALINPKLGPHEELQILSGVGVAFKLSHALVKTGRQEERTVAADLDLRDYLDLVALGTVADMVPLSGENRVLSHFGLEALNKTGWEGMRALKGVAGIRGEMETYHLGYQLGPRINAAGRIGQPEQALRLLTTDDKGEAREIADLLDRTNVERRRIEQDITDQAFAEIDAEFNPEQHFGLVIAHEGWHPGVVGIVASRITRHYNRPAIVLGIDDDGRARGSCRSIGEYNLLPGLRACDELLVKYGGHNMAAGVELEREHLDAFKARFNAAAAAELHVLDLSHVQPIDAFVSADELGWDFLKQLKRLRPFGQANPEPIWALRGVRVSGAPRVVGNNHLKLTIAADDQSFEGIAFNYELERLPAGAIDVAFMLKENRWNGNSSLQLQIQDIRPAEQA